MKTIFFKAIYYWIKLYLVKVKNKLLQFIIGLINFYFCVLDALATDKDCLSLDIQHQIKLLLYSQNS